MASASSWLQDSGYMPARPTFTYQLHPGNDVEPCVQQEKDPQRETFW